MPSWQIRFDNGHQQRYLPDRRAVLSYVLAVGPRAADGRFEVFTETAPITLADGRPGGRAFSLVEIIDLARPGETDRLRTELATHMTARTGPGARTTELPARSTGPGARTAELPARSTGPGARAEDRV